MQLQGEEEKRVWKEMVADACYELKEKMRDMPPSLIKQLLIDRIAANVCDRVMWSDYAATILKDSAIIKKISKTKDSKEKSDLVQTIVRDNSDVVYGIFDMVGGI